MCLQSRATVAHTEVTCKQFPNIAKVIFETLYTHLIVLSAYSDVGSRASSRSLNRLSYGRCSRLEFRFICTHPRVCVCVGCACHDRASADDTYRPGHAQTIFVSPSQGHTRTWSDRRSVWWCNEARDVTTHIHGSAGVRPRVKTLQGQTSAHRYEDLVYSSQRLILMLRLTGSTA